VARSQAEIQANLNHPLTGAEPGLFAYWKFDEGAGTTASDATGNGHDAVLVNNPGWTESTVAPVPVSLGSALYFDGSDDYVVITNIGGVIPTNEVTVEFWQRARQVKSQSTFSLQPDQTANRFQAHIPWNNGVVFWDFGDVSQGGRLYYTPPESLVNTWQHFALVAKAGAGGFMQIYRNGVLETNKTGAGSPSFSSHNLILGMSSSGYFQGELDEFRIWNKVRTPSEIQDNMRRRLSGTESNLVAYYRFDERGGNMTFDATPGRRNGTLINRPLRAPSYWQPVVTLNSPDPMTNECHVAFADPTTVNMPLLAVAPARYHTLMLRADGTVVGITNSGYNPYSGQAVVPARATNAVAIAAGETYSLALKADGTVVAWGGNYSGETNVPASAVNVVAIAAGREHCLALRYNGVVVAWGANWFGETTVPAGATANVVSIAAGNSFSLALKADGTILGWGNNNSGQLTVPAAASNVVAIAAGDSHSLALRADGTVVGWGYNGSGQVTIPAEATNVVAIAAGAYHSLALRADGTVVGWGYRTTSDIPAGVTNVVAIAAGDYYGYAMRADGVTIGWGDYHYGQVTFPDSVYVLNLSPVVIGTVNVNSLGTYLLTYSVTNVVGATDTATRTVLVTDRLPPVLTLIGGNPLMVNRGAAFVDPGAIATDLCTGDLTGSVVTNVTVNTSVPGIYTNSFTVTDASGNVATALRTVVVGAPIVTTLPASNMINDAATLNGTVNPNAAETMAWFEWRSVYDSDYPNSTTPLSLGSGTNALPLSESLSGLTPGVIYHYRVAASNSPWVSRGADQVFWSPAVNLNGPGFQTIQQGVPFVDPTTVNAPPLAIAAGNHHSLALKADGRVIGWGSGSNGQTNAPPTATNVVAIAAGGYHSLALKADGRVVGWGYGYYGQTNAPASATNVVAIAAGGYHSLALKADGRVIGWGYGSYGQTNSPASATNVVTIAAGNYHSLALRADGTVVGWGYNENGQATGVPTPDYPYSSTGFVAIAGQTLSNVVAVSAGYAHSLALLEDGTAVGWGAGDPQLTDWPHYGQINPPADATNVVAIAAAGFHSLALRADGTVLGWGNNDDGQTTIPASATNVVAIAAGGYVVEEPECGGHSLALRADGTIVGWGHSSYGETTAPAGLTVLSLPLGVSGSVNTNVLGTYVLNYAATNLLGAVGTATRTVVVATRPIVTTEPPTELAAGTARLQGTANPRASLTMAWFEYGLGATYGAETPQTVVGNSTNAQPFSWPVTALGWMTYHVRAVASNALGRTDGPDLTFTVPGPSAAAPALSALPDITLAQGGSTSVWFTVSPSQLDVRVRSSNPVLLPEGSLVLGGAGASRSLNLVPASAHSGSALVTVTAGDGSRSVSRTLALTVTPGAGGNSSLLQLAQAERVPPQTFRFRIVDAGTGSTNYGIEYRPDWSPTNVWSDASNVVVTPLGGGIYRVDTVPPPDATGFYRVKGFRLLMASFDSSDFTAEEGAGTIGPVIVFNGAYVGTVSYIWTDEQGTTWTNQVQVNGTTAVIPIPASVLSDNSGVGQLRYLTLRLEGSADFALGATVESEVAIEENDANWRGVVETGNGTLGFTLTILQTNGNLQGWIQSGGSGFFPTNVLAQLTVRDTAFAAVATNVFLPVLTNSPPLGFTNYVDLRLDATNGPGQTNITSTSIQGTATLASKVPGQSYLDSAVSGTFLLLKAPTPPSTNDIPLYPAP
jgi:alpha-tubulin suppressor-like RCC1 family protein